MNSPKKAIVANLKKHWDSLQPKPRRKIEEVISEAEATQHIGDWSAVYTKLSGLQRTKIISILKHADKWESELLEA